MRLTKQKQQQLKQQQKTHNWSGEIRNIKNAGTFDSRVLWLIWEDRLLEKEKENSD